MDPRRVLNIIVSYDGQQSDRIADGRERELTCPPLCCAPNVIGAEHLFGLQYRRRRHLGHRIRSRISERDRVGNSDESRVESEFGWC